MKKNKLIECEFLIAARKIVFYMTPAELDYNPLYKKISEKAKKLYSILLSRHSLAEKMELQDSDGKVYVIFPQEDIAELLNISDRQVSTLIKQLCQVSLIEKRKVGYGNFDRIYVRNILEEECAETQASYSIDQQKESSTSDKIVKHHDFSGMEKKGNAYIDRNKTSDISRHKTAAINKDYKNYKDIESSDTVIDDEAMQKLQALLGYNSAVTLFGKQIATAVLYEFYDRQVTQGSSLSPNDYQVICARIMNRGDVIGDMNAYASKSVDNYIRFKKSNSATRQETLFL